MNIYEPAAQVADTIGAYTSNETLNEQARRIAEYIRALPNPPSKMPFFTAEWLAEQVNEGRRNPFFRSTYDSVAAAINARIVQSGPFTASAPSDRDVIFAIIEREFPTTGHLINKVIRIRLAHPDLGEVP